MMTVDSVIAPELLTAELAAIEDLLVHYEDWRALGQLEARERQGGLPSSVSTSGLKAMLIEKLALNPLFLRRQVLIKELERLTELATAAANEQRARALKAGESDEGDDLTRIRGIDARLERRLNALNVRTYAQIAAWTAADVQYVASTLGLGELIVSQMWMEQAALLSGAHWRQPDGAQVWPPIQPESPPPVAAAPIAELAPPALPAAQAAVEEMPVAPPQQGAPQPLPATAKAPASAPSVAAPQNKPAPVPTPPTPAATVKAQSAPSKSSSIDQNPLRAAIASAAAAATASSAGSVMPRLTPELAPQPEAKPAANVPSTVAPAAPASAAAEEKSSPVPAKPDAGAVHSAETTPTPSPVASSATATSSIPAEPAQAAAPAPQKAVEPAVEEPAHAALTPVKPLPASHYANAPPPAAAAPEVRPPIGVKPSVAATLEPAQTSAKAENKPALQVPEIDHKALRPAAPLPASRYAGAVLEPVDHGVLSGAPVPPFPKPAATYAPSVEPAASAAGGKSAAEILEQSLPPLPLQPAAKAGDSPAVGPVAAAAPPPMPAKPPVSPGTVTLQGGKVPEAKAEPQSPSELKPAATATPAPARIELKPESKPSVGSPVTAAPPTALTATAKPSEEMLLAAAAGRAPQSAGATSQPPPLPASNGAQAAPPVPPPAAPVPARAPATDAPKTIIYEETAGRASPEARVTIRRAEEAMANAVLRVPGGTDVHLSRRRETDTFDGRGYAAYHSEVEEASVEIVRRPAPGQPLRPGYAAASTGSPASGAPTSTLQAAALAAAHAAAVHAAAKAAIQPAAQASGALPAVEAKSGNTPAATPSDAPQATPQTSDAVPPVVAKPAAAMGRFLKALTGQ